MYLSNKIILSFSRYPVSNFFYFIFHTINLRRERIVDSLCTDVICLFICFLFLWDVEPPTQYHSAILIYTMRYIRLRRKIAFCLYLKYNSVNCFIYTRKAHFFYSVRILFPTIAHYCCFVDAPFSTWPSRRLV